MPDTIYSKGQIDSLMAIIGNRISVGGSVSWTDYAAEGFTDGVPTTVAGGNLFTYTYGPDTVYRFVSDSVGVTGYPTTDAFYSDLALTTILATRGVV